MSTVRTGYHLRGSVTVSFNGHQHTRNFILSGNLKQVHPDFEPASWPSSPDGKRLLKGGMRDEVGYMTQKTAEECLRHVLYNMLGKY